MVACKKEINEKEKGDEEKRAGADDNEHHKKEETLEKKFSNGMQVNDTCYDVDELNLTSEDDVDKTSKLFEPSEQDQFPPSNDTISEPSTSPISDHDILNTNPPFLVPQINDVNNLIDSKTAQGINASTAEPEELSTQDYFSFPIVNLQTIKEGELLHISSNDETTSPQMFTSRPDNKNSQDVSIDEETEPFEEPKSSGRLTEGDSVPWEDYIPNDDDDDDSSVVSLPAELPPPPDGGWGWVVVLVSFLANMTVDGVAYSFSPFLDTFSEYFNEPKGKVAWVSSLLAGMYLSVGPIVSALTNKYGCRPVCIMGAIVGSIAYASTVFANSVPYLMVTQGVFAGFGFGLIYLPAVVCVGYYFESRRALATGIAVCGSGVGTMIFPPLVNLLIANFGWQGANLIIAGIILNACWMGALMRPLEVPKMKTKDLMQRIAEERKLSMEVGSFFGSHYMDVTKADGTTERIIRPGRPINFDPGVHSHLSFTEYLTPVPTQAALPTIQEAMSAHSNSHTDPPSSSESQHDCHDEKEQLVEKQNPAIIINPMVILEQNGGLETPAPGNENAREEGDSLPINYSQTSIQKPRQYVPKRGSMPNFDRRPSRIEIMNYLKVIPATPNASFSNLGTFGSGESKNLGGRFSLGNNVEADVLRRRYSKDRLMLPPLSRQDIFYSGSIKNLSEFKSQGSILSYRESTFNLQNTAASKAVFEAFEEIEASPKVEKSCLSDDFFSPIKQMLDFSMLKNPVFLLLGTANMIGMLGFYTPFVYLPGAAMEKGIDKESATILVSIIGVTNTIGRVLSGFIADLPGVDALWVNNLSLIFSGLCVFLTPFANSFASFIAIAVFFGFFVSPFIALTSIIIVDLMGLADLTVAFGIVCIFRGVAGITGPPMAGSIYDSTKSYDVSFYSAGALLFLCAFLHCIIPCVQKYCFCAENPVRYHTNEEYLQAIPEEQLEECGVRPNSPDGGDGAGIVFDIKPKRGSIRERQERLSFSSTSSREKISGSKKDSAAVAQV